MKKLIIIISTLASVQFAYSQTVGIGSNTSPDPSAILDVNGLKGFLPPRMTYSQRTGIVSPAVGLIVFQTNSTSFPVATTPGLYIKESAAWRQFATLDDLPVSSSTSWTVSGTNQYSAVTGNVGIGIVVPTEKLEVGGNIQMTVGAPILKFQANAGPFYSSTIDFQNNTGSSLASIYHAAGIIGFNTTGHSGLLQLPPDGNVSIGSNATLYINSIGNSERTLRLNDETPTIEFNASGVEKGFLQSTGDDIIMATSSTNTAGELKFRIKNTQKAVIDINGNMGISAVPLERLHVGGNAIFDNVNATISLKTATVDKGFVQLNGDNLRIGTYGSNNTGKFIVRVNGGDHLTIDENGNAAFGIDPFGLNAKFAVFGKTRAIANGGDALETTGKLVVNQNLEAIRVTGNDPAINFFENGTQRGFVWMTDNTMNIGTSVAGNRVNFITDQVQIGTSISTPSTYKLGVGGRIICEELKVKLQSAGWPDYVFTKNYKLKSLDEVENFIKVNHHLPNIPAAQTIEKDGLEVGEMQRRMMEKIEELTLYMIDLKKEIEVLKNK